MENKGDLVRLLDLDKDFIIDLKYAMQNNFTGQKIYESTECYINKSTAQLLIKARDLFKNNGYRLKIWDAYRPISAQKKFFEILPDRNFVAAPPDRSKIKEFRASHMNGMCVDVTLTDSKGNEVVMPSDFDDFSERAVISCPNLEELPRKNAQYLKNVMESAGFRSYEGEWWHFYDNLTAPVAYLDFQI